MGNTNRMKHVTVITIALIIAVIYAVSVTACILIVKKDRSALSANVSGSTDSVTSTESASVPTDISKTDSSDVLSTDNSTSFDTVTSDLTSSGVGSSDIQSVVSSVSSSSPSLSASSVNTSSGNTSSGGTSSVPSKKFESAMWFSYGEDLYFKNSTEAEFKSKIDTMFDNTKALGCDAVICQVRPYADAYYYSAYFPMSEYLTGTQGKDPGYDAMKYMISAAHSRGLQFHAWLNPYRISTSTNDVTKLHETHPARIWRTDSDPSNDRYVLTDGNGTDGRGLYFNPAVPENQQLIINGVREILENYDVDGIHIDDYFYPTTDPAFDGQEYQAYRSAGGALNHSDWRRANVNALVSGIYREVHKHRGVVFGISPSYHISTNKTDKNYTDLYADIAKWMSSDGFIDYIAPQIYFGYEHSSADYAKILKRWLSIPRKSSVKLYIGLAAYKIDPSESYTTNEWQTVPDILARQAMDAYNSKCDGVFIFNYSPLFSSKGLAEQERDSLSKTLNTIKS